MVSENDQVGDNKALNGKNVLLVEDDRTLCMLAKTILYKLRATLHVCENGKEALDLVETTLKNKASLPFDYIFMNCKVLCLHSRVTWRYNIRVAISVYYVVVS